MPADKNKDYTPPKKETSYNTGKEGGNFESEKDYQEKIEGGHGLTIKGRAKVLLSSFQIKLQIVYSIFIYIPIILSIMYGLELVYKDFLEIFTASDIQDYILFQTQVFYFSWIPEIIFATPEDSEAYLSLILGYIGAGSNNFLLSISPIIYMVFHLLISYIIIWGLVFSLKRDLLKDPDTYGEKWRKVFEKALGQTLQSQGMGKDLRKNVKKMNKIKPFIEEVKKNSKGKSKYFKMFSNFLPVYKFFFNKQDSIRANQLAGTLNQRWENRKKVKQTIGNEDKFFNLLDSGYKYGETPRDDVKRDIVDNLKYLFISDKNKIFHKKIDIFKEGNLKNKKRNVFVLLCATTLLKNQILVPLYRYLEKEHGIVYNRSQKQFISGSRKIYEVYVKESISFNNYKIYDFPLSIQYDYPFQIENKKKVDLSYPVSVSINKLNKTQQTILGYVQEIDSLLPKTAEFGNTNSAFNDIFIKNINLITVGISKYILERISYDKAILRSIEGKEDGLILAKIQKVVSDEIMGKLIIVGNIGADDEEIEIFENGDLTKIPVNKIKINKGTNRILLQQMSLTSYSLLKNELSTISLGYMNYIIDYIYNELEVKRDIKSTLDQIMWEYKMYDSFNSINMFLIQKSRELQKLK